MIRKRLWTIPATLAVIGLALALGGCPMDAETREADGFRGGNFGDGPSAPVTIRITGLPAAAVGLYATVEIWEFGRAWHQDPALRDPPAIGRAARIAGGSVSVIMEDVSFPLPASFERLTLYVGGLQNAQGGPSSWGRINLTVQQDQWEHIALVPGENLIPVSRLGAQFGPPVPPPLPDPVYHMVTLNPGVALFPQQYRWVPYGTSWFKSVTDVFDYWSNSTAQDWEDEDRNPVTGSDPLTVTGDITLTAQWNVNVRFWDLQGGNSAVEGLFWAGNNDYFPDVVAVHAWDRPGYNLIGWSGPGGSIYAYDDSFTAQYGAIFTAIWAAEPAPSGP